MLDLIGRRAQQSGRESALHILSTGNPPLGQTEETVLNRTLRTVTAKAAEPAETRNNVTYHVGTLSFKMVVFH